MDTLTTNADGLALWPIRHTRASLRAGALRAGVTLAGCQTIADAARRIVLAGTDLHRVWYRLPEEVSHYADQPYAEEP